MASIDIKLNPGKEVFGHDLNGTDVRLEVMSRYVGIQYDRHCEEIFAEIGTDRLLVLDGGAITPEIVLEEGELPDDFAAVVSALYEELTKIDPIKGSSLPNEHEINLGKSNYTSAVDTIKRVRASLAPKQAEYGALNFDPSDFREIYNFNIKEGSFENNRSRYVARLNPGEIHTYDINNNSVVIKISRELTYQMVGVDNVEITLRMVAVKAICLKRVDDGKGGKFDKMYDQKLDVPLFEGKYWTQNNSYDAKDVTDHISYAGASSAKITFGVKLEEKLKF